MVQLKKLNICQVNACINCTTLCQYFVFIGEWLHWMYRVEEYIYASDSVPEFSSILVPNVDNVRTNFLIDTIAKQYKVSTIIHTCVRMALLIIVAMKRICLLNMIKLCEMFTDIIFKVICLLLNHKFV